MFADFVFDRFGILSPIGLRRKGKKIINLQPNFDGRNSVTFFPFKNSKMAQLLPIVFADSCHTFWGKLTDICQSVYRIFLIFFFVNFRLPFAYLCS